MQELANEELGEAPFARWAESAPTPPAHALAWLASRLGTLTPETAVAPEQVELPPSGLPDAARAGLRGVVGTENVDESTPARLGRAGGQSYSDLIRRRTGTDVTAPDAVVRPASHDEVLAVLATCAEHRIAVVPYGGGTSVVGGVHPEPAGHPAVITLDLRRLDRMLAVDPVSLLATFGAGVTGPRAEALLGPLGLTLGHVPQSFARATLGGYVATRSSGQASTGYGRIDAMLSALRVATPVGELALGTGTPNAAGPDLRALFVGSEGALGVLTEVTVRVRPAPEVRRYEMWAFPSFDAGLTAARELVQAGHAPDVVRLSDAPETELTRVLAGAKGRAAGLLTRLRGIRTPVFCVLGWEGARSTVQHRRALAVRVLRGAGAIRLGTGPGESWRRQRFAGPYQRDLLLDAGVLVETLETATSWSRLADLHEAVGDALRAELTQQDTPPLVLAHVSHLYPTGASLYFTVMARRLPGTRAALEQWRAAKAAASTAIVARGGTITHHHGVGRDHAPYLPAEIGDTGISILSATKATVDPHGILNPGVLIE